jgi:sugar-specific transcriptional regulator TrmB
MKLLHLLKKLGFTEYESKIFLSLVKLGEASVKDLVIDSNIPRSKIYEVLENLRLKNAIVTIPVTPKKFKVLDIESINNEITEMGEAFKELKSFAMSSKVKEIGDFFWIIKSQKAIQEKLILNDKKVKREIIGTNKFSMKLYNNIKSLKETINRGVEVKMISTFDKNKIEIYKKNLEVGVQIRIYNEQIYGPLFPRITAFDGKTARMTVGEPEIKDGKDYITLWTESRVFSQMFRNYLQSMWENSIPIEIFLEKNYK